MSDQRITDIRRSFDGVAETYEATRPHYPAVLFDELFALLPPRPRLVEMGPGTGQATGDLIARGASVLAIELGPSLAARLRAAVPSEALEIVVGDFELVDLPAASFDGLVSSCAYHWVSSPANVDRPAELLRAGGIVGITTLEQVDSPDDRGFYTAAQPIYNHYGEGHKGPPSPTRENVLPAIATALRNDDRFADVNMQHWIWNQTYTSEQYRRLMSSFSGTQMMEATAREGLLDDIKAFIDAEFGGSITRPLEAVLTTAIRR